MKNALLISLVLIVFISCKKDKDPEPTIPELQNWETVYSGHNLEFREEFFALDNNNGGLVINTPTTVRLLTTADGGKTWTEKDTYLSAPEVRSVAFQSKDVGYISLFGKGVYRTIDGGDSWDKILECTCGITADDNSFSVIMGNKTLYSNDQGETFEEYNADLMGFQNPFSSFRFGNDVYFYYLEGMIKSTDGGRNWEDMGLNFSFITSVTPVTSTKWYLISNFTLFRTENAGATWTQVDNSYYNYFSATKGDTLFVNRNQFIHWTTDGVSFTKDDDKVKQIYMFNIGNNVIGFGNNSVYRRKF